MSRTSRALPILLILLRSIAAAQPLSLPSWLTPYPESKADVRSSTNSVDVTYQIAAKPDEVLAHYRKLLVSAKLPYQPNFDGVGTTLRAAAAECELLIRVKPTESGTTASVSCSPKSSTPIQGAPVASPSQAIRQPRPRSEAERRAFEEAEAGHAKRTNDMAEYDRPVYPKRKKSETRAPK